MKSERRVMRTWRQVPCAYQGNGGDKMGRQGVAEMPSGSASMLLALTSSRAAYVSCSLCTVTLKGT